MNPAGVPVAAQAPRVRWVHLLAGAGFLVLACALYAASWNGATAGFLSDDAVYVLLADGFSPFRAADAALTDYVLRQSIFPPGYPLLLAVAGAGSAHLLLAHIVTTSCVILALAAFAAWTRSTTREFAAAVLLVPLLALSPGMLLCNLELMSEAPYLMWSLAAIWLAERDGSVRARDAAAVAVCVALALLTRSAGWSLLLAFGVWLAARPLRWRFAWLVPAVLPMLVWMAYKSHVAPSGGGYGALWLRVVQPMREQGASFVLGFVAQQLQGIWQGLCADLDLRPAALTQGVLALIVCLALLPWWQRLRARRLDAWYLFFGGGMVLLYPFPSFFSRLLLPWIPLLLCYAWLGAAALAARVGAARVRPLLSYALPAVLLLALAPTLAFIAMRWSAPLAPELQVWKHTRYWYRLEDLASVKTDIAFRQGLVDVNTDLARELPPGECVFAVHTAITMLYSGHIAQRPPPAAQIAAWPPPAPKCSYALGVAASGEVDGQPVPALYPLANLSEGSAQVLRIWPGAGADAAPEAMLVRLTPVAPASPPGPAPWD